MSAEERKLEWACRQIERLLARVAELEGRTVELETRQSPERYMARQPADSFGAATRSPTGELI